MSPGAAGPGTVSTTGSPAEEYAAYFGPAIFEPLAEVSTAHARPRPGERALDLACGTGILTRRLAEAVGPTGAVVGVDINPAMVEVAVRTGSPTATSAAPVQYLVGDAVSTAAPSPPYDLVSCQQGLQFMPDRAAAARTMRAALRPGGRAVVACWRGLDAHPLHAAMAEAELPQLRRLGLDVDAGDMSAPFSFGDPDRLAAVLRAAGFSTVQVHEAEITAVFPGSDFVRRVEHAYSAVVPRLAGDPAALAALCDAVETACAPVVDAHRVGDDVVVPMRTLVAVATC